MEKIKIYEETFNEIKNTYSLHALKFKKETEINKEVEKLYEKFMLIVPS